MLPFLTVQNPVVQQQTFAYLDYGVAGEPWHERWLAHHVRDSDYVVITPDHDVYVETIAVPPLRNLRVGRGPGRLLPDDLGARHRQPVYRFSGGAIPDEVQAEARALAEAERPGGPILPVEQSARQ